MVDERRGPVKPRSGNPTLDAALAYLRAGLSLIPIKRDGSKAPEGQLLPKEMDPDTGRGAASWNPFKERLPTEAEARRWFGGPRPPGIAVLGGKVSGGLELSDFDREAETIFPQWRELVESEAPGLLARLCVVRTPRPGYHVRYRCTEVPIPGNMDLAIDPVVKGKERKLIETRGEGGYGLAPGSPAECHELNATYEHVSGPALTNLETITAAEREVLIRCARSFNREAAAASAGASRPGDDYNRRGPDWAEILVGWTVARTMAGGVRYWTRPAKTKGWSATTGVSKGPDGVEFFNCFSSNAHPFEGANGVKSCSCYTKFAAYTLLHHGGDYKAAVKELARQGYGDQAHKANGRPKPAGESTPEAWEPPVPLGLDYYTPAFPIDALPSWMAEWAEAEARATQTPPDLAALLAIVFAAAGLAKKHRVTIRDGWGEPLNLFAVVSLLAGERKSAVYADALAPVHAYEQEEQARMAPLIAAAASEHRILEAKLKHIEAQAAKADDSTQEARLRREARETARKLAEHVVPEEPVVYCDDETPESLARLLALHGGRMLQAGAEGTAFEIAKGRYSECANFDVYLKGHAGDPLRTGRIGRAREAVERPALSVALAVQPDVIRGLAAEATMRGRGFLARFLYGTPASRVGTREVAPPPVSADVASAYRDSMLALWRLPGAVDESGKPAPHWLSFSAEADRVMRAFEAWLEPQMAEGEELASLAGWTQKLAGAVARISGVFHMAGSIGEPDPWRRPVDRATVSAAVRVAEGYLIPHARAAFGLMGADSQLDDARRVVRRLSEFCDSVKTVKGGALTTVSKRDIHATIWGGARRAEELDGILDVLTRYGYLRSARSAQTRNGPGREPSPRFEVNPAVMKTRTPFHRIHRITEFTENGEDEAKP
jgi:hypothetical protein